MLKGFRDFILRGNVVDLAVAVIIGAAFNAIVNSFVKDILGQFIAAVVGKPDFSGVVFKLNGTPINVGNFLNATISFLIVAFVVYIITKAIIKEAPAPPPPPTKICPRCKEAIVIDATKCKFCTADISN